VEIEHETGLGGHSDADVICHAVMDSLLGALALGDIGQHFPDNDPAFAGADSIGLLKFVVRMVTERGYEVGNLDITVIAEKPKLAAHIDNMRMKLAGAMNIAHDDISIKATTNENVGLIGKGEGIAAFAVALLNRNKDTGRAHQPFDEQSG
jgi:2-C-methyl-D-erythritol 2,4-cyclodiphosphate synthase